MKSRDRRWQDYCRTSFLVFCAGILFGCQGAEKSSDIEAQGESRPNILLIVADDLGFADLGIYGSEINTPNIDALAEAGIQFTNFYADPSCSPTRARLMSGTDNHLAGLGVQAEFRAPTLGQPGYEGYLNHRVATLPELLADAGYHTYMTGKWHLGYEDDQVPFARGFQKTFALLGGGAHHLNDMSVYGPKGAGTKKARYRENGWVAQVPDDFYSTRFFTEKLMEFIESDRADGKPFFGYLAYTAPHWPLQAPKASIDKYKGRYDAGYDALHAERVARMGEFGLIPEGTKIPPRRADIPVWESLSDQEKRVEARKMEIYAAMVDDMDFYVGQMIQYLKDIGEYDNTLILFISDNGPDAHASLPPVVRDWYNECCDHSYENMGHERSWVFYGPQWARAGVGHLLGTKTFMSEGGIKVPAILSFPKLKHTVDISAGYATVMDILPTFLDVAKTSHPGSEYKGRQLHPVRGVSLWPFLTGDHKSFRRDDYFVGWEVMGRGAVRQGDWKLLREKPPVGDYSFKLYNLAQDPTEMNDLADKYPEKYAEMKSLWQLYQEENGVITSDSGN